MTRRLSILVLLTTLVALPTFSGCDGDGGTSATPDVVTSPDVVETTDGATPEDLVATPEVEGDVVVVVDVPPADTWQTTEQPLEASEAYVARREACLTSCAEGTGRNEQSCRVALGMTDIAEEDIESACVDLYDRIDCSDFRLAGLLRLLLPRPGRRRPERDPARADRDDAARLQVLARRARPGQDVLLVREPSGAVPFRRAAGRAALPGRDLQQLRHDRGRARRESCADAGALARLARTGRLLRVALERLLQRGHPRPAQHRRLPPRTRRSARRRRWCWTPSSSTSSTTPTTSAS